MTPTAAAVATSTVSESSSPVLVAEHLVKHYPVWSNGLLRRKVGEVKALNGVSFSLGAGETLGVVGESGCGKSTLGRVLLRLLTPSEGRVLVQGEDWTALNQRQLRARRPAMQAVFQNPYDTLNPKMRVLDIIAEPLEIHRRGGSRQARQDKARELAALVGLNADTLRRTPGAFSGGQRQRIGIARALALDPQVVIADEAVSALDVSIQAQILNLFADLQQQRRVSYVFISHNLSVVRYVSHRVAVMYLGQFVELAPSSSLFHTPLHPYTQALIASAPVLDLHATSPAKVSSPLEGDPPNPMNPPPGCAFHTRCPIATDECRTAAPLWEEKRPNHWVACHAVPNEQLFESVTLS